MVIGIVQLYSTYTDTTPTGQSDYGMEQDRTVTAQTTKEIQRKNKKSKTQEILSQI